ncbi:cannabinoid receptor 2-like [Oculina patagonica]
MKLNLTTNGTQIALEDLEMEQAKRPCFFTGISQTFQLQFFYYSSVFLVPVTSLLGLWCFLSNGLVLIAILRGGLRIRPGFLLLCSLTLTDVVLGGLVTPMYVRHSVEELLSGKACTIPSDWDSSLMPSFFFLCLFSTLGNLGVISVDRYLAVAKPMWYKTTVKMQHAIFACSGVWLSSVSMVILRHVKVPPPKALEIFQAWFIILFSCLVVAVQILTLVTLRKHNNAVAQVMEESARVNPATANNAIERQLAATTRHVVCLLVLLIIPLTFLIGLSQILGTKINLFVRPLFYPTTTLCSGINPVLYYRGNAQIRDGITKLVKWQ